MTNQEKAARDVSNEAIAELSIAMRGQLAALRILSERARSEWATTDDDRAESLAWACQNGFERAGDVLRKALLKIGAMSKFGLCDGWPQTDTLVTQLQDKIAALTAEIGGLKGRELENE